MIRAALDHGAQRLAIALGGSATNDGGAGMAQALGARLLDAAGHELPPGGAALADLAQIDLAALDPRLQAVEVIGVTDVTNPLCGSEGASAVYGPQKGSTPAQVAQLDAALAHFAKIIARVAGRHVAHTPGAGAAGGLGAGLLAFLGPQTRLVRGAEYVLDAVRLDERIAAADLIFTGEGRLDDQVVYGKLTGTLATHAHQQGKPVIAVVGGVGPGYEAAYVAGITAIIVAADGPRPLAEAMAHAAALVSDAVARGLRLWRVNPA
jgi:glycerate kinase